MLRLAVVGKDVSGSLSPQMHAHILGGLGRECTYEKLSVSPEHFGQEAEGWFSRYDGFNVTIPFKREILPFLRSLEGDARSFGAVNTVKCAERAGYNTDGGGFALMLLNAGIPAEGRWLVLGAGGAGRSCIKTLLGAGAEVFVYERDRERLMDAKSDLGGFEALTEVPTRGFDYLLNCTGVGMHDTVGQLPTVRTREGIVPLPASLFEGAQAAVDLIYTPAQSEFLRVAAAHGKRTLNGGSMLFYQAYLADCVYLGREPSAAEAGELFESYRRAHKEES